MNTAGVDILWRWTARMSSGRSPRQYRKSSAELHRSASTTPILAQHTGRRDPPQGRSLGRLPLLAIPDGLLRPCREPDTGPVALTEATTRRVLQRVDGNALGTAIDAWLTERARDRGPAQADPTAPAPAVDGKTVRGAHRPDGTRVHLLSAMSESGLILAQWEVDAKSNEITAFRPLLAPLKLTGCVVTLERVYAVTSLAAHQTDAAGIVRRVRGCLPHPDRDRTPVPWPLCATSPSAPSA